MDRKTRELAKAAGIDLPYGKSGRADVEGHSVDWGDFDYFTAELKCPHCNHTITVTNETLQPIDCSGCKKPLAINYGDIEIEAQISLEPDLTAADRAYLEWKAAAK